MSIFEFVLTMTSVITGLALAHMIVGAVGLIRNADRVKFSLVHALWMFSAFALAVGNWAADWELRTLTTWPAWTILLLVISKVAQYTVCAFVTPDIPPEGVIDLRAFHEQQRRKYLWTLVVFGLIALVFNFSFGGALMYSQWLRDSAVTLIALAVLALALIVPARWAQGAAAAAFAALAAYFMAVSIALSAD